MTGQAGPGARDDGILKSPPLLLWQRQQRNDENKVQSGVHLVWLLMEGGDINASFLGQREQRHRIPREPGQSFGKKHTAARV